MSPNGPSADLTQSPGARITTRDILLAGAASEADVVALRDWTRRVTDAHAERLARFKGFQVNNDLMSRAKPDAIFLHCLPAHRGEEVAAAVIDGPQSVVFDQAENRLHAQKAIMVRLMGRRR